MTTTPRTDAARYINDYGYMEPSPDGDFVPVEVAAALETELYAANGTSAIHAEFGKAVERWAKERKLLLERIEDLKTDVDRWRSQVVGPPDLRGHAITYSPALFADEPTENQS